MCYHASTPKKDNLRTILNPNVRIELYNESEFLNGFDKPELPALLNTSPDIVQPLIWDFTPPNSAFALTTLNARCETLFSSRLYGESARERRCLIFLQGMYEWSPIAGSKNKKQPYYIERIDKKPFAVGGVWKDWGGGRVTFSMVTTPANELFAELRPAIVPLFKPYKDGEFAAIALAKSPLARK